MIRFPFDWVIGDLLPDDDDDDFTFTRWWEEE